MDNSSKSNGPQVSTEVGEIEIDYKQRCKYLENRLEKFQKQAAKIREVIGHKYEAGKLQQYKSKLEDVSKENEKLKSFYKQAMEMVREIKIKLNFSQDQVVRLSRELVEVQSQCKTDQGESGFQSFQTEEVRSQSPLKLSSSLDDVTPTLMSPDDLAQAFIVDNIDDSRTLNFEDPRAALNRGLKSPERSRENVSIQVLDSHNPYMQLHAVNAIRKHFGSQSTVDSELEDSTFDAYLEPGDDQVVDGRGFHAQLGELGTRHLECRRLAPSVARSRRTEQDSLFRSSVGSFTEPTVTPNPIYQTLEQEFVSAEQELDSVRTCLDSVTEIQASVDSAGLPLSPPPPSVPPRFENVVPPPVPPVPKTNQRDLPQEAIRMEANFTSNVAETELQNDGDLHVSKEDVADTVALLQSGIQSLMRNDNSAGPDSPPFGTLESPTKDLNMLTDSRLKVAPGSGIDDMETEFEKGISQLIAQDCEPESEAWNTYVLTHTKDPITEPLTTLPSKELETKALDLFKSILLFTTEQTQEAAIDDHVSLAQNAMQTCLDNPELQNEIYCQLIKQTSKYVSRGPEGLGDFMENCGKYIWLWEDIFDIASQADQRPVQEFVYIQAWQLLALCTALFVPKDKFLTFLKGHLNKSSTFKTKLGKYATYCNRSLKRTLENGKREARPSRMELCDVISEWKKAMQSQSQG